MKSKFLLLSIALLLFAGCKKEEVQLGSLYGTVNEKVTGNAIANVSVELIKSDEKSGESISTDDDGSFEFRNIEEGVYNLLFTKPGYESLTKEGIVVKGGANSKPVFVQMEKLPPSFRILDDSGNDLTEKGINFGYEPEDNMRSFTLYNDGEDKFEWSIPSEERAKWIKTISPDKGELRSHQSQPVLVVIDRSLLNEGNNESTIIIQPENNIGKQIKVTALAYQAPLLILYEPSDVSYEKVTLEASISNPGFPEYQLFGFFISKNMQHDLKSADKEDKNISVSKKDADEMMEKQNRIIQQVTNLTPNDTYYARAYAIRDIDTTYSKVVSFVTKIPNLPKLTIKLSDEGVNGLTASFDCEIIDNGGSEIIEKGVCWSTDPTLKPKDFTSKLPCGKGSTPPTYTAKLEGLEANKNYYVYSYAENSDGIGFSDNPAIVKTSNGKPAVETVDVVQTSTESVDVIYEITNDAGIGITEHGVCYGTTQYPDITTSVKSDEKGDIGIHTAHISGLKANTTYYFRAYAQNASDIGYAENQKTWMIQVGMPKVKTLGCSEITSTSVVCKGNVTEDGGSDVIERGICWSINANPTVSDSHQADIYDGLGVFSCTLTNLSVATTYHYRAYAKNKGNSNYAYGEDSTFTTKGEKPTVETQPVTNITSSSATLNGKIISTGGLQITMTGFAYMAEGDYSAHQVQAPLSGTTFSYHLDNLQPNTKYFVQAYAKNSDNDDGLAEGTVVNFVTKSGTAQVSTVSCSNVGSTTATVTGKIITDNGFPITECGICYSESNKKPTVEDGCVRLTNVQSGEYSCELKNLKPSTKYYARAYAQNSNGYVYDESNTKNFTTKNGTPAVEIAKQPTYYGNSATIYGKITDDGGANITHYGVVYSTANTNPSIDNYQAVQMEEGAPITNDFTFTVTNVPSGTMIYYRIFVVNALDKIAYSSSGYLLNY